MRYDWEDKVAPPEFSKEFYEEINKRFFCNAAEYLAGDGNPFFELIDRTFVKDKDVLEIGVGNGSHAQLLAASAKSFAGIDLTDYAVKSTTERLKIFNLNGSIQKMDAEKMTFPDKSFDYVWSWGVIHHSSSTEQVLREIKRVLRPGGRAIIMVYHRGWWNYYITVFVRSLFRGELFKRSIAENIQLYTDGALARYYTPAEWRRLCGKMFEIEKIEVMGPKSDVVLLPSGRLKNLFAKLIPDSVNRFFTRRLSMGTFLVSHLNVPN
ncbi:MAG: methylase involved in ubiquinone/menaquinone biosynthesi [Parcubacteria group bacterium LiPW_15]|nr:MAG: methylase involved in ubiquinone/menaquinone biosynthesi [Parcubacteria group bacterium LiPW_15]